LIASAIIFSATLSFVDQRRTGITAKTSAYRRVPSGIDDGKVNVAACYSASIVMLPDRQCPVSRCFEKTPANWFSSFGLHLQTVKPTLVRSLANGPLHFLSI
jgi:hypothetical protein